MTPDVDAVNNCEPVELDLPSGLSVLSGDKPAGSAGSVSRMAERSTHRAL